MGCSIEETGIYYHTHEIPQQTHAFYLDARVPTAKKVVLETYDVHKRKCTHMYVSTYNYYNIFMYI
jgi:hypothetical protein